MKDPKLEIEVMSGQDEDHAALIAACEPGVALCTIVHIEGSFSRRLGAQLAVLPDGGVVGSLADGCLEKQLATDIRDCATPVVTRYGHGSRQIDFRLPCGGGLDILLDSDPDRAACRAVVDQLDRRKPARLCLANNPFLPDRAYIPRLRLRVFGEDPELAMLEDLADAAAIPFERHDSQSLSIGREPDLTAPDRWTAVVLLFHDHEWESALLRHSLSGDSFYVGAQGGANARAERIARLLAEGVSEVDIERVRGPVGVIPSSRTPRTLALSILSGSSANTSAFTRTPDPDRPYWPTWI